MCTLGEFFARRLLLLGECIDSGENRGQSGVQWLLKFIWIANKQENIPSKGTVFRLELADELFWKIVTLWGTDMRSWMVFIATLLTCGSCLSADSGYFVGKSKDGVRYWIDLDFGPDNYLCDDGKIYQSECKNPKDPHVVKLVVEIEVYPYHKDGRTVTTCVLKSSDHPLPYSSFPYWHKEELDCSKETGGHFAHAKYVALTTTAPLYGGTLYGLLCVEHCNRHIPKWFDFRMPPDNCLNWGDSSKVARTGRGIRRLNKHDLESVLSNREAQDCDVLTDSFSQSCIKSISRDWSWMISEAMMRM